MSAMRVKIEWGRIVFVGFFMLLGVILVAPKFLGPIAIPIEEAKVQHVENNLFFVSTTPYTPQFIREWLQQSGCVIVAIDGQYIACAPVPELQEYVNSLEGSQILPE